MAVAQKIIPFLWFDDQAEEAVRFYVSIFPDTRIGETSRYSKDVAEVAGRPKGSVMTMSFEIAGQSFTALNGGPLFGFTPAFSLFVNCADVEEARGLFSALAEGGTVLMPFQQYPFNEGYGWAADRYGVSWQVHTGARPQKIAPCLMFTGEQCGRAEEAMALYTSLFPGSGTETVATYGAGEAPNPEGSVKHAVLSVAGQELRVMDSGLDHPFTFTEATSLLVQCENQQEIDRLWDQLTESGDPKAQQCGWLKDRFGVSWQIAPRVLFDMLRDPDPQKGRRVTQAFLKMKKFDVAALQRAFEGASP